MTLKQIKIETDKLLLRINNKYKIPDLWHILRCKENFRCHSRFCPECSNIRSKRTYGKVLALIKRIREKIENNANKPEIIKTIRGIGYKIET